MNYNVDLPEELKRVSKPRFKIGFKRITIYNMPFWDDWVFAVFISIGIIVFIINSQIDYRTDYLLLFIAFGLFGLSYFSLNKVVFDFDKKMIRIKNYNPLVNIFRNTFKMPFEIRFDEIEKFYADWKPGGPKSVPKYFTILQTDAPYKFRIAIFQRESQAIIFTDYLNKLIKYHSIHTAQVGDTTMMP